MADPEESGLFGKPAIRAAVAALSLLLPGCAGPAHQPPPTGRALEPAAAHRLDSALTGAMETAGIPGAIVGVWSPEGEYVKAFGVADTAAGTPMKTDFFSRIGSVTKTFISTAVLQLVDRGKLNLDDPIAEYVDGVPGGAAITVRQVATMRSGLGDYTEAPGFVESLTVDPSRSLRPEQLLDWAFTQPAMFEPDRAWRYNNTNYILLGLLVERVSGQSLRDYLNEHILGPLNLSDTSLPPGTEFPRPHARGYTTLSDTGPVIDATDWSASSTWAAGGMISTLEDTAAWARALADGALISPALQEERLRSAAGGSMPAGVGYGIGILSVNGWIGHNGSVPGYQSVAVHLPARDTTLVILANSDIPSADGRLPSTVLGEAVTAVLTPDHLYDV